MRRPKITGVWPCVDDVDLQGMILVVMKARWARMNFVPGAGDGDTARVQGVDEVL